jgi:hypothetical protein
MIAAFFPFFSLIFFIEVSGIGNRQDSPEKGTGSVLISQSWLAPHRRMRASRLCRSNQRKEGADSSNVICIFKTYLPFDSACCSCITAKTGK